MEEVKPIKVDLLQSVLDLVEMCMNEQKDVHVRKVCDAEEGRLYYEVYIYD